VSGVCGFDIAVSSKEILVMALLPVEDQKEKVGFIKDCQGDSVCNQAAVRGFTLLRAELIVGRDSRVRIPWVSG
jgi:hypothetical protein